MSLFNVNLVKNLKLTFACCRDEPEKEVEEDVRLKKPSLSPYNRQTTTENLMLSIIPVSDTYHIDNLYPITDHVEFWNIFVVGNDKTYILANVKDPHIFLPQVDQITNERGNRILPPALMKMFDNIWTKTLAGEKLQFYLVWDGKLFFVNTYPFLNGNQLVIGAIMFMRAFDNAYIKDTSPSNEILNKL
jgi:hypothetical protein